MFVFLHATPILTFFTQCFGGTSVFSSHLACGRLLLLADATKRRAHKERERERKREERERERDERRSTMDGTFTGSIVATGLRAPPNARGPRLNQRPRTTMMTTPATAANRPAAADHGDDEETGIVPSTELAEGGGGEVAFRFRTSFDTHVHPLSQPNFAPGASAKTESAWHATKPTELNTKSYGNFLKVSPTKHVVSYVGIGRHANDVGAIQSDYPVPTNQLIYYFELKVLDAGRSGCIAIGFTDSLAKLSRQPGWEANSYGYHGDDGHKFHSCGRGEEYGPTFTTGDVIGAGIHLGKAQIFFTKNGKVRHASIPFFILSMPARYTSACDRLHSHPNAIVRRNRNLLLPLPRCASSSSSLYSIFSHN